MTFLTDEQRLRMLANGAARTRGETIGPLPVVKLYTLDAGAAWLLTELDADEDRAFGLCDAGTGSPELGRVSLSALEGVRGPRGMLIVADPHFKPRQPLSGYLADAQRDGSINDRPIAGSRRWRDIKLENDGDEKEHLQRTADH